MTREDFSNVLNDFCDVSDRTQAWIDVSLKYIWQVFGSVDFLRTGTITAAQLKLWYEERLDSWTNAFILHGLHDNTSEEHHMEDVQTNEDNTFPHIGDFRTETYAFFQPIANGEPLYFRRRGRRSSDALKTAPVELVAQQWADQPERLQNLAKICLVLDAKRRAHIKAASIIQRSTQLQVYRKPIENQNAELSEIMATVLAKYNRLIDHQIMEDEELEILEEDKPLPEFSNRELDESEDKYVEKLDLTSLFQVRAVTRNTDKTTVRNNFLSIDICVWFYLCRLSYQITSTVCLGSFK